MPEPSSVLIGGVTLLLALAVISLGRFSRLRQHIQESAAAVATQRDRRDRLAADLRATASRTRRESGPPGEDAEDRLAEQVADAEDRLAEQVADAEDRLVAASRLHCAQVRAWNRLGRAPLWGLLRGPIGWRPLPEPPAETLGRQSAGGGHVPAGDDGRG